MSVENIRRIHDSMSVEKTIEEEMNISVVQRAEIEWGGIIARHARGRFALNSGKRVNFTNFLELLAHRGFP